jgi:hypothetical protein
VAGDGVIGVAMVCGESVVTFSLKMSSSFGVTKKLT